VFFFSSRRRHTRFSRDWSSDVCSSDWALAPHVLVGAVVDVLVVEALADPLHRLGALPVLLDVLVVTADHGVDDHQLAPTQFRFADPPLDRGLPFGSVDVADDDVHLSPWSAPRNGG